MMGYYLRYIISEARPIALEILETALTTTHPAYAIVHTPVDENSGDLFYGETILGVIEIHHSGDDIFEDDIADLLELISDSGSPHETRIQEVLQGAQAIVAVEAVWQGKNSEAILQRLDPLWDWLFEHYAGLLEADNEGFYDKDGLILELNLKI